MPKPVTILAAVAALAGASVATAAALGGNERSRQEAVAQRGARVMPFSLEETTHVFDSSDKGGTQRVVAKDPRDAEEIRLIRKHLREEATAFGRGEFADPAAIHGDDMPGLQVLRAGYSDVSVTYRDLPDGAEIEYRTDPPELAAAIRAWFDAQLRDHAGDATTGSGDHAGHSGHQD